MFNKSTNPVLKDKIFAKERAFDNAEVMTINGTIHKTIVLLGIVMIAATYTWRLFFESPMNIDGTKDISAIYSWMIGGAIGGFVVAMAIIFMKQYASFLAPVYAVLEGLFLGAISAVFENMYPGIVMNAVLATFSTFFIMLFAYRSGLIKVTEKFRSIIIVATGAVAAMYFLSFILSFFGVEMSFMHGSGLMSIGISLVVIVIAALNLLLDFDFIERGAAYGTAKYMEWFGAFGILLTLVWLYVEFLRLLAKLRD